MGKKLCKHIRRDGRTTRVGLTPRPSIALLGSSCGPECKEHTIAVSIVKVFPSPITSARIPPSDDRVDLDCKLAGPFSSAECEAQRRGDVVSCAHLGLMSRRNSIFLSRQKARSSFSKMKFTPSS